MSALNQWHVSQSPGETIPPDSLPASCEPQASGRQARGWRGPASPCWPHTSALSSQVAFVIPGDILSSRLPPALIASSGSDLLSRRCVRAPSGGHLQAPGAFWGYWPCRGKAQAPRGHTGRGATLCRWSATYCMPPGPDLLADSGPREAERGPPRPPPYLAPWRHCRFLQKV